MSAYPPPNKDEPIFNKINFQSEDLPLTISDANNLYVRYPNFQSNLLNLTTTNFYGISTFFQNAIFNNNVSFNGSLSITGTLSLDGLFMNGNINMNNQNITNANQITAIQFNGNLNGNASTATNSTNSTNAINASNVGITATNNNSTFYLSFVSNISGNNNIFVDNDLTYNPSSNTLSTTNINATNVTASNFIGSISDAINSQNVDIATLTGTDRYITITDGNSGNRQIRVNNSLRYNGNTNTITATLNGNSSSASQISTTATNNTAGDYFITFVSSSSSGNQTIRTDFDISYNPSTNRLTVPNVTSTITGTVSTLVNHTTNNLQEGNNNLYFTQTRARQSISSGTGVSYDNNTGIISIGQAVNTNSNVSFNQVTSNLIGNVIGQISSISNFTTTDLVEGTNLYYTDTRTRQALSSGTGVGYDNNTGVISIGQSVGTTDNVVFNQITSDLIGNVIGNLTGNVIGDLTGNINMNTTNFIDTGISGIVIDATELSYLDGITSNIQNQINSIAGTSFTPNRAIVSDGSGDLIASSVTDSELGFLSGVSSTLVETTKTQTIGGNKTFTDNVNTTTSLDIGSKDVSTKNGLTSWNEQISTIDNSLNLSNQYIEITTSNNVLTILVQYTYQQTTQNPPTQFPVGPETRTITLTQGVFKYNTFLSTLASSIETEIESVTENGDARVDITSVARSLQSGNKLRLTINWSNNVVNRSTSFDWVFRRIELGGNFASTLGINQNLTLSGTGSWGAQFNATNVEHRSTIIKNSNIYTTTLEATTINASTINASTINNTQLNNKPFVSRQTGANTTSQISIPKILCRRHQIPPDSNNGNNIVVSFPSGFFTNVFSVVATMESINTGQGLHVGSIVANSITTSGFTFTMGRRTGQNDFGGTNQGDTFINWIAIGN
jgi:hypothetical protein